MLLKKSKTLISSTIGAVAVLVIILIVNTIVSDSAARIDLTQGRIYTLSEGTKRILEDIDSPVTIRFYLTQADNAMPVPLRTYAEKVENLLKEYRKAANGKVEVKMMNPEPDSEAEDSAALDGIQGQPVDLGNTIYLGLSFTSIDRKESIPFLTPAREELLEYDISRAISEVTTPDKPSIGVMSALNVFGQPQSMMNPMAQQSQPWIAIEELDRMFDVRQLPMNAEVIPEDIDLLVLLHPNGISPATEYAVDQYLMRGGQIIACLDPYSLIGSNSSPNPMMPAHASVSNLPNLLPAWGLEFSSDIVADLKFRTEMGRAGAAPEPVPGVLSIDSSGINDEDVLTSQMDSLLVLFAGAFIGKPASGIEQTILVSSSDKAKLVDRAKAESSGITFPEVTEPLPLAVRLVGEFNSAFPAGNPTESPEKENNDIEAPAEDAESTTQDAVKAMDESRPEHLTKSRQQGAVILFGDSDMLFDQFSVQVQNILGQQFMIPRNANLDMLLNSAEQLAGNSNLIHIRSRGSMQRPFTVVREMEAEAETQYRERISELEAELTQTQLRLAELQESQPDGQDLILSPEQEKEIQEFESKRIEVRNELKNVRRQLRRDVDALETRLKWLNIAGMPLIVIIVGIIVALVRKKRIYGI